jgi:hypothetical protein
MKLRLKNNSIRLRLTKSETGRLAETGSVEEAIEFGLEPHRQFIYALEVNSETNDIRAALDENRLTVSVPPAQAAEWVGTELVGLTAKQSIGAGKFLSVLIEKDFACLEPRAGEDEDDAFPHPSERKVC